MIGLSFSCSPAKAQDLDQLHEKIKQNWAFPDCGTVRESTVFTRFFYLKAGNDGISFDNYEISPGGKDFGTLKRGDQSLPARIENDGILKIGHPAAAAKAQNWEDFDFDHVEEYTACAKPSQIIPKAAARLLRYVDRIKEQCVLSLENDCARVLFKLADEDNNQQLTPAEIQKGIMTALLFAELSDKEVLSDADIKSIAARIKKEGGPLSDSLFAQADQNKSKTLDYNEISTLSAAPTSPLLKEILEKTGKFIPVFKLSAN